MNAWQIVISNLGFYSLFTMSEEITVTETGCLKPGASVLTSNGM